MNRIASLVVSLAFALSVAACGGGGNTGFLANSGTVSASVVSLSADASSTALAASAASTGDGTRTASALAVHVSSVSADDAALTTSATSATSSTIWTPCATEGNACTFTGIRAVRYGAGTQLNEKVVANSISCDNDTFGDPAYGTVKTCWYSSVVQTRAAPDGWSWCGDEEDTCSFTGTRLVRFGFGTATAQRSVTSSVLCSNSVFGDPIYGTVKSCWYQNDAPIVTVTAPIVAVVAAVVAPVAAPVTAPVTTPVVAAVSTSTTSSVSSIISQAVADASGSSSALAVSSTTTDQDSSDVTAADQCQTLAPIPSVPTSPAAIVRTLASFCTPTLCARPDDNIDDTAAIQAALDQSAPGTWLIFGDGKYLINATLRVKKPGVTLWGKGTTIHGTNWDDQSIIVEANDTSIYNFKLTAVTDQRGGRAEHTRIAIYGPASVNPIVKNTIIRGNTITNAGDPGTNLANASTGAGIFVMSADGFLIADNTVVRTLADGIHLTGGAKNGRVLNNTVRETGDDMIAVVSYAYPGDPATATAASIADGFAANKTQWQDSNILIANNNVSGQYWGRGISVVGGRDITIRSNTLTNLPYGAAIYLVRETPSGTYGLSNVLVEKNTITDNQTGLPPYNFGNKFQANQRTGHGAIEISGWMFVDENSYPLLASGMSVTGLTVRNNTITNSSTPGVRLGVGYGGSWSQGNRAVTGTSILTRIAIQGNVMKSIQTNPSMQVIPTTAGVAQCSANTTDGTATSIANCTAPVSWAPVAGESMTCTK